jgi:integrase
VKVQLLKSQQEGRLTEVRNETIMTFGLYWVQSVKPQHIRPTTAADYEYRLRQYVFPYLGSIRMVDLTTQHIVKWMNDLRRDGCSSNTINGARRVLAGLCKYAARTGNIPFNPVTATDPIRRSINEPTQVGKPWTLEQMTKVLEEAQSDSDLDCFLHLMLHTGMRPGEVFGLRWEDYDREKKILKVTGTLKQARLTTPDGSGVVRLLRNEPKTTSSRRSISVTDALGAALGRQEMYQSVARMSAEDHWKESGYVITTSIGSPVASTNLRRKYVKYLSKIETPYIRFHDIRHSVATMALNEGVPMEQVSEVLGHSRIETTKAIYAPFVQRSSENFALLVGSALPQNRRNGVLQEDPLVPHWLEE